MNYVFSIPMLPVSVNKMYRTKTSRYGQQYVTKNQSANVFADTAYYSTKRISEPLNGRILLKIVFVFRDKKSYAMSDCDNLLKNSIDALVSARIIKDDRYIVRIEAEKAIGKNDETKGEISLL